MSEVKYPGVEISLVGQDGNAFAILGAVKRALRNADVPPEEIESFFNEAMDGDYNHLLSTCMKWVTVY